MVVVFILFYFIFFIFIIIIIIIIILFFSTKYLKLKLHTQIFNNTSAACLSQQNQLSHQ